MLPSSTAFFYMFLFAKHVMDYKLILVMNVPSPLSFPRRLIEFLHILQDWHQDLIKYGAALFWLARLYMGVGQYYTIQVRG